MTRGATRAAPISASESDAPLVRLRFIADIRFSPVDKKSADDETPVLLCNYTDVYRNREIVSADGFMEATATPDEIERFTLRRGDVLVTKDSETPDDIAVPALVREDMPGVLCGYHLAVLRPRDSVCRSAYLAYALRSRPVRSQFYRAAKGVTRFGLTLQGFGDVRIPLPSLQKQDEIVAWLDERSRSVEEALVELDRTSALLEEQRRAALRHRVTHGDEGAPLRPVALPGVDGLPEHWDVMALRRAIRKIEQGTSPVAEDRTARDGEWAVVKLSAVSRGRFRPEAHKALPKGPRGEERYALRAGDFLLTRANTPLLVGDVAVVDECPPRLLMSDLIYRLDIDETRLDKHFLKFWLLSGAGRFQISRSARGSSESMVKISQTHILEWLVPVPPVTEQRRIAERVELELHAADLLAAELTDQARLLTQRRAALIDSAISGVLVAPRRRQRSRPQPELASCP